MLVGVGGGLQAYLARDADGGAIGPDEEIVVVDLVAPRTVLDVNGSWQLSQRLSLVASANNVFNVPMRFLRYGDDTPSYARRYAEQEYGIALALGLRGSF